MVCLPAENSFTPCVDVLETDWLRGILWGVAVLAIIGNLLVLLFTIFSQFKTPMTVTKFLICNLAFADAMLGIYLISLAAIDLKSMGDYFNYATWWQYGGGCDIVGFITVFASELSVYTLSVITLERWYAISHAIYLTKRLSMKQALLIMSVGWILSLTLAGLPLYPDMFSSYQLTSICLPFKFETTSDKGFIGFLLAFNVSAFILVFCCYVSIFYQVRGSNASMASDTYLARRMAILIFTDFVCWGPVAIVAGLFAGDVNIPQPTSADTSSLFIAKIIMVVFYPFNACANPFLYAMITKQFQKDCVTTLNQCGICHSLRGRKRWRPLFPHDTSDGSQWSMKQQAVARHLSSNTTASTQLNTDCRASMKSSLTDSVLHFSRHSAAPRLSGDSSIHAYPMKVFNSQFSYTSSRAGKGSLDYSVTSENTINTMPIRRTTSAEQPISYQSVAYTNDQSDHSHLSYTDDDPQLTLRYDEQLSIDDNDNLLLSASSNRLTAVAAARDSACRCLSKLSDHDSGTDINHTSESEVDKLLPHAASITIAHELSDSSADVGVSRGSRVRSMSYSMSYDNGELVKLGIVDADDNSNNIVPLQKRFKSNKGKGSRTTLRRASVSSYSNRASSLYESECESVKVRLTDSAAVADC